MLLSCPLPANHLQHLINPAEVASMAWCCWNHYCPALFHVRGLFASSVMKPISLYLHPFASLITVLMNSLKELSYESLETQSDRYMGYLLTTGNEMKASGMYQNSKIITVSPYPAPLEILDVPFFMYSSSSEWNMVLWNPTHLQIDFSSLYNIVQFSL